MSSQTLTRTTDIAAVVPRRNRRTLGNRVDSQRRLWNGVGIVSAFLLVFPIYWMVNTACL